jgi:hypothetical protein
VRRKYSEPTFFCFKEIVNFRDEGQELFGVLLIGCFFAEFHPAFFFLTLQGKGSLANRPTITSPSSALLHENALTSGFPLAEAKSEHLGSEWILIGRHSSLDPATCLPGSALSLIVRCWLGIDTGIPHLDRQLTADVTLMQIADKKEEFEYNWDKLFGKQRQLALSVPKELQP